MCMHVKISEAAWEAGRALLGEGTPLLLIPSPYVYLVHASHSD